ncbi:hypothetical protein PRZ48_008173 [Zasmidium cellare]|uniref:F-box domain-containing protein n=1 Tax=Zasmidium cellare TaxID=395010 RepID=A0ABR0EET9_ZASCE|nr:hypothetical protein PRZ48_008173 [Zasmidium cellare]
MTTPREQPPSRLLSLPAELLACIAENCEADDLLNLRLTCRELTAASNDAFAECWFSTRYTLLADPTSMQNLVRITEAPHFCRKMKHLRFSLVVLQTSRTDYRQRVYENGGHPRQTREGRIQQRALRHVYLELDNQAQTYRTTGAQKDFHAIMKNLADSKVGPLYVSMVDSIPDYETPDLPPAHQRLSKQLGYEGCLTRPTLVDNARFCMVMKAINVAKCPIKGLALGATSYPVLLAAFTGVTFLASLRELGLNFGIDTYHYLNRGPIVFEDGDRPAELVALMDALLHSKQLESLTLVQGTPGPIHLNTRCSSYQQAMFNGLIRYSELHQDEFLPALQTLEFNGWLSDISLLERFKELKAPTLSEVIVHGVQTVGRGHGPLLMV